MYSIGKTTAALRRRNADAAQNRGLEIARSDLTIILRILLPDVIDPELVADRIVDHVVVAVVRAVWLSLNYAQRVGNSLRRPDLSVI